jgi:acyl-CoA hydrolase
MVEIREKYNQKLVVADQAVKVIKSGDSIHYGIFCGVVQKLDEALAKRAKELEGVKVYLTFWPYKDIPEIIKADPSGDHFDYMTFHMSGVERRMNEKKLCYHVPMQYREIPKVYTECIGNIDVAMLQVSPMDRFGNFNIGPQVAESWGILKSAKKIIVEVNPNQPVVAGIRNTIHIDDVDFVVEGDANPLPTISLKEASKEEKEIASQVIKHIESGSTLQLGIGSLPNYIGTLISESEIDDLSIHSPSCNTSAVYITPSTNVSSISAITARFSTSGYSSKAWSNLNVARLNACMKQALASADNCHSAASTFCSLSTELEILKGSFATAVLEAASHSTSYPIDSKN